MAKLQGKNKYVYKTYKGMAAKGIQFKNQC